MSKKIRRRLDAGLKVEGRASRWRGDRKIAPRGTPLADFHAARACAHKNPGKIFPIEYRLGHPAPT